MVIGFFPSSIKILGFSFFFLTVCVALFLAYREYSRGSDETSKREVTGYRLYCGSCGHQWEVTAEEWEMAGQQEQEVLSNTPLSMPSKPDAVETFERIEWKPPRPWRGMLIVLIASILLVVAASSAYAVLWSLGHRENLYVPIFMTTAFVVAVSLLVGLAYLTNRKTMRILPLLFLVLIGLIGFALAFLLK